MKKVEGINKEVLCQVAPDVCCRKASAIRPCAVDQQLTRTALSPQAPFL